jgi:hypothetical protein
MKNITNEYGIFSNIIGSNRYITALSDLPPATNGIINLQANTSYYITGNIDLNGNRLNCLGNVAIIGSSSETSSLYSDLSNNTALLTSAFTLPIQNITLGCSTNTGTKIFNLEGDGSNGIDLLNVNFGSATLTCGGVGTIKDYSNVIFDTCAWLSNNDGLTLDGTIGTIGINNSLFSAPMSSGSACFYLPNTLTITRRFRIIYSSLIVISGRIGVDYNTATIPNDGFILDTINFSGGGTYIDGITYLSNLVNWINCIGIVNSFVSGEIFLQENTTPTTFSGAGVNTLMVGGTTTNINTLSKFTHNSLFRMTYVGNRTISVIVTLNTTIEGSSNRDGHISIARNGGVITTSEMKFRTTGAGNYNPASTSQIVILGTNDYLEGFIRNDTNTSDMIVHDAVMSIYSR